MVESNCKAIVIERIIYLTSIALATILTLMLVLPELFGPTIKDVARENDIFCVSP